MNFAHHHALLPLVSERTQWLQVRLHQERLWQTWGIAPGTAPGFFPTETAFSERLIPLLASLGIQWTFVSNEHLSRACPDFPEIRSPESFTTLSPNSKVFGIRCTTRPATAPRGVAGHGGSVSSRPPGTPGWVGGTPRVVKDTGLRI